PRTRLRFPTPRASGNVNAGRGLCLEAVPISRSPSARYNPSLPIVQSLRGLWGYRGPPTSPVSSRVGERRRSIGYEPLDLPSVARGGRAAGRLGIDRPGRAPGTTVREDGGEGATVADQAAARRRPLGGPRRPVLLRHD